LLCALAVCFPVIKRFDMEQIYVDKMAEEKED
jgi:hypothetical protein